MGRVLKIQLGLSSGRVQNECMPAIYCHKCTTRSYGSVTNVVATKLKFSTPCPSWFIPLVEPPVDPNCELVVVAGTQLLLH